MSTLFFETKSKIAAGAVLLALVLLPAPLVPPLGLAEVVQSGLRVGWKPAYLATAVGLHVVLYGSLGVIAAYAVGLGSAPRGRWLRLLLVLLSVVGIAVVIRSLKLGHVPLFANAIVPIGACALGVVVGLAFRQHGWRTTSVALVVLLAGLLWAYWPGASSELSRNTETQLRRLVAAAPTAGAGDERFGNLLQTVFAPLPNSAAPAAVIAQNRAAISALGIAIGHERLARFAGLDRHSELVRAAAELRGNTTVRGRPDWARHFCLSAALAVVETPFLSDTGGLLKEQLDALTQGSGFSFGDLAADRAGVRFAIAATDSKTSAQALQSHLQVGFIVADFFSVVADLPENLSVEQFRDEFGGVGSPRYRQLVAEIETRLGQCAALAGKPLPQN